MKITCYDSRKGKKSLSDIIKNNTTQRIYYMTPSCDFLRKFKSISIGNLNALKSNFEKSFHYLSDFKEIQDSKHSNKHLYLNYIAWLLYMFKFRIISKIFSAFIYCMAEGCAPRKVAKRSGLLYWPSGSIPCLFVVF